MAQLPLLRPDVAIIEARLPDGSGIDVCREIRLKVPEVNILMLSTLDSDDALFDSIIAGAAGYLLKNIPGTDLVENLRTVAAGVRCSTRRSRRASCSGCARATSARSGSASSPTRSGASWS